MEEVEEEMDTWKRWKRRWIHGREIGQYFWIFANGQVSNLVQIIG